MRFHSFHSPILISRTSRKALSVCAFAVCVTASFATVVRVDVSATRDYRAEKLDAAVRDFGSRVAALTSEARARRNALLGIKSTFSMPISLALYKDGRPVPPYASGRGGGDPITLNFNSASGRTFPDAYKQFLMDVYTKAKPVLDATFGAPSVGGNVLVSNFDADIGERDAVAGGYFYSDGTASVQEIRFPVYADNIGFKLETTAINFIHCLLLAYIGPKSLPDAWEEGLVRATVMKIARSSSALPSGLDLQVVEQNLESTYDIGAFYDWNNQRALSGPQFIAPNLRDQPLPIGGSTGGLYLVRYLMAGSAFQKVLTQYPGFPQEFLNRYYPLAGSSFDLNTLPAIAQQTIDTLRGSQATIEGLDFATWKGRQRILETSMVTGNRLHVQPFPITSNLSGTDFGVFAVQVHWFKTDSNGNETLLRDTCYPISWTPDFTRVFTAAQDDKISIVNGYGSVVPNYPSSAFAGEMYRMAVDVPVQDQIQRVYLPAGAIATAANPIPNNFYGCLTGIDFSPSVSYAVKLSDGAGDLVKVPVLHGAFGVLIPGSDPEFPQFTDARSSLKISVLETKNGAETEIYSRTINKGPGPLAVNLHVGGEGTVTLPSSALAGLNMVGFIGEPYPSDIRKNLSWTSPSSELQLSRWNPTKSFYDFFPNIAQPGFGQSVFHLIHDGSAPKTLSYDALAPAKTPLAVALKPGWNMIVNPLNEAVSRDELVVVATTQFPRSWVDAVAANMVGTELFTYLQGPNDPGAGFPTTGSFVASTLLQPGETFFVKVFSGEGATILFPTQSFRTRSGDSLPLDWEVAIQATTRTQKASARIGGKKGAGRVFDKIWDVELPPAQGALQASLMGTKRLYREVRGMGRGETFALKLDNVKKGDTVTLDFRVMKGKVTRFAVHPPRIAVKTIPGNGKLTFIARTDNPSISIVVPKVNP